MNEKAFLISDWWQVPPGRRAPFYEWQEGSYKASFSPPPKLASCYSIEDRPEAYLSWNEFDVLPLEFETTRLQAPWSDGDNANEHERFCCDLMRDVRSESKPSQQAPWLYLVHTDIEENIVDEYTAWYDEEHLPRLVTVPGIVRARRYIARGAHPRYLTAYDLTDRNAFESPAGLKARKTAWTEKMRALFFNTRRSMARLIRHGAGADG